MDGADFFLVTATTETKFSFLHSIISYLLIIWEFLLTATNKNNLDHCRLFPTIALTENLPPNVSMDEGQAP